VIWAERTIWCPEIKAIAVDTKVLGRNSQNGEQTRRPRRL
jgi:hypothetical protein